jgi:hypothetical protein
MGYEYGVEWGCGGSESVGKMDGENRFDLI